MPASAGRPAHPAGELPVASADQGGKSRLSKFQTCGSLLESWSTSSGPVAKIASAEDWEREKSLDGKISGAGNVAVRHGTNAAKSIFPPLALVVVRPGRANY
jgi:hypothetical protein